MTEEEIEAGKTAKGGWTKKQLQKWGVGWPPPRGWRQALLKGDTTALPMIEMSEVRRTTSANDLLRQVVSAVIERGHASDLYEFPDVLAHFGAQMPKG